jgi:hypothetical protein
MRFPPRLQLALAAGLMAAGVATAQLASAPEPAGTAVSQAGRPSVSAAAPIRPARVRQAPQPRAEAKPSWAELTPQQQQSLAPLSGTWRVLGEAHKRKWLVLSKNYPTMAPAEQALLHSRMTEWAALSPQQRSVARLNFAEAKAVAPGEKRAKWEAYQALPPEEKRKLAAGAAAAKPAPPPMAAAVQPVPQQRLARIPKPKKADNNTTAKIAVVPGRVDQNTLLPQQPVPAAP